MAAIPQLTLERRRIHMLEETETQATVHREERADYRACEVLLDQLQGLACIPPSR